MKNQINQIGKKLNKKQLRTIKGGLINCIEPVLCPTLFCEPSSDQNGYTIISPKCSQ